MLIYIEGVDCTGKSTLATELSMRCKPSAPILHHRGKPLTGSSLDEYLESISWYDPRNGHDLIVDRGWLSEIVYSQVYGRPTDMDDFKRNWLVDWYRQAGCQYVLCVRRDEEGLIAENVAKAEPLSPSQLRRAMSLYHSLFEDLALPYIIYDFTAHDRGFTTNQILEFARDKQRHASRDLGYAQGG